MKANLILVGRLNGKNGTLIDSETHSVYCLVPGPEADALPPDGKVEVRAYLCTRDGNLLYHEIVPI
jgi:hypothetical protein